VTSAAEMAKELRFALDPAAFARERLGFAPDAWQERVLRTSARQVLMLCSRQSGKSSIAAVMATHCAVYNPGALVLLVSKAQRQSGELLSKVQSFVRELRPMIRLESDSVLSCRLSNGSRVVSLPGDENTVRGYSAPKLVVEDEAGFVSDELHQAIRPMMAVSGGQLVLLSTPNGQHGHLYRAFQNPAEWHTEIITADQVPRISREFLEKERATIGEYYFAQEYRCQFVDTSSQLFSTASINAAIAPDLAPLELSF
jgi:Terminase large subunit, T4likevirus-type, N-terminal